MSDMVSYKGRVMTREEFQRLKGQQPPPPPQPAEEKKEDG